MEVKGVKPGWEEEEDMGSEGVIGRSIWNWSK